VKRWGLSLLIDIVVLAAFATWLLSSGHPTLRLA